MKDFNLYAFFFSPFSSALKEASKDTALLSSIFSTSCLSYTGDDRFHLSTIHLTELINFSKLSKKLSEESTRTETALFILCVNRTTKLMARQTCYNLTLTLRSLTVIIIHSKHFADSDWLKAHA